MKNRLFQAALSAGSFSASTVSAQLFTDPSFAGAAEFNKMITGGLKSVMGIEPFCQ